MEARRSTGREKNPPSKRSSPSIRNGALAGWRPGGAIAPDATLDSLVALLSEVRLVVDANLRHPARWRGALRREVHGESSYEDQLRYAAAYDHARDLADAAEPPPADARLLCALHRMLTGEVGFRGGGVAVGGHTDLPLPERVPELVENAFSEANKHGADPAVSAVYLQLRLIEIHPFNDGNGRAARLLASYVLMRAGYRSTLLAAVEQQLPFASRRYFEVIERWRTEAAAREACIADVVRGMLDNAWYAAWFRARQQRLRAACEARGLQGTQAEAALVDFDLHGKREIVSIHAAAETPWCELREALSPAERGALGHQLARLRDEEAEDPVWRSLHERR